jgi:CheY-like chemotaxis protein
VVENRSFWVKLDSGNPMSLSTSYELARVLLVDDDPASRLILQTVLKAGGYNVDAAASGAEAVAKMDEGTYELVLSDLQMESPQAGLKVLAHARNMEYKPATALITTYQNSKPSPAQRSKSMLIKPEDLPGLLSKVADLIGERASRRLERELRAEGRQLRMHLRMAGA